MGIEALSSLLGDNISRRSLQRRLFQLVAAGRLINEKKGRSTRYFFPPLAENIRGDENSIPLSPSGIEVQRAVRKPQTERTPVSYHREFLDQYRPNESKYLTSETIAQLTRIGRTLDSERPAGTYARHILDRLLVDLSWASSQLEGNTYSLLDTRRLIEYGQEAEGKAAAETQMILNHKAAIEFLVESAEELEINRQMILNLHALLSDNLLPDPGASGRLRRIGVGITDSVYHPLEVPQLIEECFQQVVDTAAAIREPFEQAFFTMVHLPYLQPFEDVNKRVSRLAANIPLIRYNLCPLSFVDVPQRAYIEGLLGVYELNRVELLRDVFVWAYERSSQHYAAIRQSLGEPDRFRLRFRSELIEVIGELVRRLTRPSVEEVTALAVSRVPQEHLDDFVRMTVKELENLHEGNYARFRLRPSEYEAWRGASRRTS
ncbi:MAG: Fic family protein [Acidobacteria bacterium]|nr:Fic family protein [Acidobacteriota bacterium]